VKRHYVAARDNKIVNRLNKTKREEQVDHEAQRVEREKARAKARREVAVAEVRSSPARSLQAVALTCAPNPSGPGSATRSSRSNARVKPTRVRVTTRLVRRHALALAPLTTLDADTPCATVYGDEALAAAQAEKARVARAKAQEAAERAAAGGGDDESDGEESDDSFM
jgi:hypothetical protein